MSESIKPINQSLIFAKRSSTTSELEDQYIYQCNRLWNTVVGRSRPEYTKSQECDDYGGMTIPSGCCWENYHCGSNELCCRNHNPEVQGVCLAEASFYIELRRPLSAGTNNDRHHLHIAEIKAFDDTGAECTLTYSNYASPLVKLGATWAGRQLTPADAIDGDTSTVTHNDYSTRSDYGTEDHYMEFETQCNSISKIQIYNRPDSQRVRILGSVLYLFNRHKEVIIQQTITTVGTPTLGQYIIEWEPSYHLTELHRHISCWGNGSGRDSACDATNGGGLDCCIKSIKEQELKYVVWYGQQCWGSDQCSDTYDLVSASVWDSGY